MEFGQDNKSQRFVLTMAVFVAVCDEAAVRANLRDSFHQRFLVNFCLVLVKEMQEGGGARVEDQRGVCALDDIEGRSIDVCVELEMDKNLIKSRLRVPKTLFCYLARRDYLVDVLLQPELANVGPERVNTRTGYDN